MKQKIKNFFCIKKNKKSFFFLGLGLFLLSPLIINASLGGWIGDQFVWVINWFLYGILIVISSFLFIAGSILDFSINPAQISSVLQMESIRSTWMVVRDILNLGFILVLLFSAFATIFQVSKYHIKNIIILLIVMALLVNFSFPITLFIIDASNMLMYFFVNAAFPDGVGSFSSKIAFFSNISELIGSDLSDKNTAHSSDLMVKIAMLIIFTFIFLLVMTTVALLLLVRIFVLAVLLIFSPVGFVANIFPGTASFSGKFWDNLFKYAFLGPILTFFLILSLLMMNEMMLGGADGVSINGQIKTDIQTNAGNEERGNLFTDASFFMITIVILVIGIKVSLAGGVIGGNLVTGLATKIAKAPLKAGITAGKWGARKTGIPGGIKKRLDEQKEKSRDKIALREAKWAAGVPFTEGYKKAGEKHRQDQEAKKMAKQTKEYNEMGDVYGVTAAKKELEDPEKGKGAAMYLAGKGAIDNVDEYDKAMKAVGEDINLKKALEKTTQKKRVDVVIDYKIKTEQQKTGGITSDRKRDIAREQLGNLTAEQWKDQNMEALLGYNKQKGLSDVENDRVRRIAAQEYYHNATAERQENITKNMNGNNYAAAQKGMMA